mmetsp:Transcript_10572/g.36773  ORF Transcript_10572/g.36773 Transcript_10572/m.36773 type:complete len:272 (-) Transcript_10572:463-1278(-)
MNIHHGPLQLIKPGCRLVQRYLVVVPVLLQLHHLDNAAFQDAHQQAQTAHDGFSGVIHRRKLQVTHYAAAEAAEVDLVLAHVSHCLAVPLAIVTELSRLLVRLVVRVSLGLDPKHGVHQLSSFFLDRGLNLGGVAHSSYEPAEGDRVQARLTLIRILGVSSVELILFARHMIQADLFERELLHELAVCVDLLGRNVATELAHEHNGVLRCLFTLALVHALRVSSQDAAEYLEDAHHARNDPVNRVLGQQRVNPACLAQLLELGDEVWQNVG